LRPITTSRWLEVRLKNDRLSQPPETELVTPQDAPIQRLRITDVSDG